MVNGLFLQPMAFIPWSNKYIVTSSDQQHVSRHGSCRHEPWRQGNWSLCTSYFFVLCVFSVNLRDLCATVVFFTTGKRRAREKHGVIVTKHTKHAQRTRRNDFDCPSGLLKHFSPLHSLRGKTSGRHKSFTTISVFPRALLCLHGKKYHGDMEITEIHGDRKPAFDGDDGCSGGEA